MNSIPSFPLQELSIPISPGTLSAALVLSFLLWITFSIILHYHWKKYCLRGLHVLQMSIAYFIGSIALFACALAFYLAYVIQSF